MQCRCSNCGAWYDGARALAGGGGGLCPFCTPETPPGASAKHQDALRLATRAALLEAMPDGVRAALDRCLRDGVERRSLLLVIRQLTGGPSAVPGGLTYLQCEAYLYPEGFDGEEANDR